MQQLDQGTDDVAQIFDAQGRQVACTTGTKPQNQGEQDTDHQAEQLVAELCAKLLQIAVLFTGLRKRRRIDAVIDCLIIKFAVVDETRCVLNSFLNLAADNTSFMIL